MPTEKINSESPKRCFVVMGFGIKTDFATGRKLDLNKSYRLLVKPVIESKGLTCIRADEIRHSGTIDLPMYQELLNADVVIADLSTANVNAFYELGIRHALRPYTTIVISEDKLTYPFDLNHIKISSYTHMGDAIDYEEVERFRKELGMTLDAVLNAKKADSPVYEYLDGLIPPSLKEQIQKAVEDSQEKTPAAQPGNQEEKTLSIIVEQGEEALKNKDFDTAKALFGSAVVIGKNDSNLNNDSYLLQRLALCTYKAKKPDEFSALKEAIQLLEKLDIEHTNDPETVALAGKIEKRLYKHEPDDEHLTNAILYYERGYYLLNNRYHGINLSFLLNKRVDSGIYMTEEDKIADMVWANRIRRQVLKMCEKDWNQILERKIKASHFTSQGDQNLSADRDKAENEQKFWILVNKAEAHFGLGEIEEYKETLMRIKEIESTPWMMKAFTDQITELRELMKKHGHLLNPAWTEEVLQPA